ncbi:Alpha/Beta hydrolase protein [Coprinopsis sp. MPI-PUGE-AT-0042]|nr:Alpha/Beta hydrolase protein [Coprinopsis sp. MPI-PUGE-AT-0042]
MPHISVTCPSGTHQFFYSIATPSSPNAVAIDEELPVVLFIHSGYIAQEAFESQFADPEIRRFNLLAIDVPGHGATLGFVGDQKYTPKETAQDFKCVMDALKLPPVHLFGLSNGGTVALELACAYPDSVLSLTVCSPLTPAKIEEVAEGRLQVFEYWTDSFKGGSNDAEQRRKQDELLNETLSGVMQLSYNNEESNLLLAIGRCAMVRAIDTWSGSRKKLDQSYAACITWFTERREIPSSEFAKIQCPVNVIHCSEDFAYPLETAEGLVQSLKGAGVGQVDIHQVEGPHYGNIASAERINHILRDIIFHVHQTNEDRMPKPEGEFGYNPAEDEDAEDDWPFTSWFDIAPVVEAARRANSPQ